jgi:hypothetical protein
MNNFPVRFPTLIVGIVLGFAFLRLFTIDRPIFYKWPTPENAGKVNYKDKNGTCYTYDAAVVDCNLNKDKVKPIPLQVPQPYLIMK